MFFAGMRGVLAVRKALFSLAVVAGLTAPLAHANETGVLIWPVTPVLQSDQKAEALWLENTGKKPMVLQIRVFGWTQSNYSNQFANQATVIPSPPMARIEPGQKQLVRLIRSTPVAPGTEQAFRIQLDEVPVPEEQGRTVINGLGVLMRYSLPLYAYGDGLIYGAVPKSPRAEVPANTGGPELSWQVVNVQGKRFVEVVNVGRVHAQLSRGFFNVPGSSKQIELSKSGLGAVLANSRMRWPMPDGVPGNAVLTMKVNGAKDNVVIAKAQ